MEIHRYQRMSELSYREWGDPRGHPVLLLHGFLGASDDWEEVVARLGPAYRCIAPDLPGHGASQDLPFPEVYSMEGAAGSITRLLQGLGIESCTVVGYSMGGRMALHLAIRHPDRCSRLVLESASPGLASEAERMDRRVLDEARAHRLESGDLGSFLDEWYRQPLFAYLWADENLMERMIARRRQNRPEELARSLRGMGTGVQTPLWDDLEVLRVPALAVAGARDGRYVEIAQRMALINPIIRATVISRAGHAVHAEFPDVFARLVAEFMQPQNAIPGQIP